MKNIKIGSLLLITLVTVLSCKKGDTGTNWANELNGSVWAGEFRYTSGNYTGHQPFSLVLNNGSLTWYQSSGDYPASWSVIDNKITITFPDGRSLSARVSKDSWGEFSNITNTSFDIMNLTRSAIPGTELNNTAWTGLYGNANMSISFLPGQKVGFAFGGGFTTNYTAYGAGIKYTRTTPGFTIKGYGVFTNSTSIKGVEVVSTVPEQYIAWSANK